MCKVTLRHQVVCFDDTLDIVVMNADGHTHEHVLGAFSNASIDAKEIGSLKGLEPEAGRVLEDCVAPQMRDSQVVMEITIVDDGRVEGSRVLLDDLVGLFRYHARRLPILWIDWIVVQS